MIVDVSFRAPIPCARSLADAAGLASAFRALKRPDLRGTATVRGFLCAIWSFRAAEGDRLKRRGSGARGTVSGR